MDLAEGGCERWMFCDVFNQGLAQRLECLARSAQVGGAGDSFSLLDDTWRKGVCRVSFQGLSDGARVFGDILEGIIGQSGLDADITIENSSNWLRQSRSLR